MSENKFSGNNDQSQAQSTLELMQRSRRWLLWKYVGDGGENKKMPYYADGSVRQGTLDSRADVDKLVTYEEAIEASDGYSGVGFALGYDDVLEAYWQGIDLDKVKHNGLDDLAKALPGYVELSPSGLGVHAIGLGEPFSNVEKEHGVEAYCSGRYFTFTGDEIRDSEPVDFLNWENTLGHMRLVRFSVIDGGRGADEKFTVDKDTVEDLWQALQHIPNHSRYEWMQIGMALASLAPVDGMDVGWKMFRDWSMSQGYPEWHEAAKGRKITDSDLRQEFRSFRPNEISYKSIFAIARQHGFVNDLSWRKKEVRGLDLPRLFNVSDEVENQPKEYVVNNFIRTGTFAFAGQPGGGKSTILTTLATAVSGLLLQPHETIQVYLKRRVLWFAEAPEQITDILKVMRENGVLEPDTSVIRDMIKVYYSRRAGPDFWDQALPVLLEGMSYRNEIDGGTYDALPLIVFDTTSANFEIESENDNSEVSRLIANVRRVLRGYPVWLIAHTAKAGREVSVFDLDARGASAWKGDVEGTAAIGRETADGLRDYRFLRFQKRRYSAQYDWIIAERKTYETQHRVLGAPGGTETSYVDTVEIRLVRESEGIEFVEAAREAVAERQLEAREAAVLAALQEAANAVRGEGFEGLVVRIQSGRQAEGPIEGYEKLKRVTMEDLRTMARITSGKKEVKEWFKQVVGRLFEVNGDVDVPGCIVAVRAQNFEFRGN